MTCINEAYQDMMKFYFENENVISKMIQHTNLELRNVANDFKMYLIEFSRFGYLKDFVDANKKREELERYFLVN